MIWILIKTEVNILTSAATDNLLRSKFLLDPSIIFLNHGSFGACPIPVFEEYQRWQLELERQPVEFLGRRADTLLEHARQRLGDYLHAEADDLVYVPNATLGLNTVARSLDLQPGDEILTTDHEYGALNLTWEFVCRETGARYVQHHVSLPLTTAADFVDSFWESVTEQTRVIFLSHVTSPTALTFPVTEICKRARAAGILTMIDGAHVPGQLPLDLTALDADVYSGNCHKWLCSPKGSAFLWVHPDLQKQIDPLVISWGWQDDATFVTRQQWQGTRDLAAFLSVPAAIDFARENNWEAVRAACHTLVSETRQRVAALTGLAPLCPDSTDYFMQMAAMPLPVIDAEALKRRLYDEFRIEIPIVTWQNRNFARVSIQGYNTRADANCLLNALQTLLPQVTIRPD